MMTKGSSRSAADLFMLCFCCCFKLPSATSAILPGDAEGLGELAPVLSAFKLSSGKAVLR